MKQSIWQKLKKPFFILAPMENVTDTVFRQMVLKFGKPDLFFTEFTNSSGLCSVGKTSIAKRLEFTPLERPIIAQIWGKEPKHFLKASKMIAEMQFDGIDINMGCPDRKIVQKGSCGGLIQNHELAGDIIHATKEGAGNLPISVKTRLGFGKIETEKWISFLLSQELSAITIHARTVREMSKVPAHWEEIGKAVALRNQIDKNTLIIGNGDITTREEAFAMHKKYHVDGIMIGRGVFHNPWIFNSNIAGEKIQMREKLRLLIEHINLFDKTWYGEKPFHILKKFYKIYVNDIEDANEFRTTLMNLETPQETVQFLNTKIASLT